MNYVEFGGGLGDVINQCYRFGDYKYLGGITEKTAILLFCHNPYAVEIFNQHPNSKLFDLRYEGYPGIPEGNRIRERLEQSGLRRAHPPSHHNARDITFYPTKEDLEVLSSLPSSYVSFQPFSGCSDRDVPPHIVEDIDKYFASVGVPLVLLGRNYKRPAKLTTEQTASKTIISTVDKLTVPGTIELVKRSKLFIGGHSSMCLLAWHNRIKNYILVPKDVEEKWFRGSNEWNFGMNYENSRRCEFGYHTTDRLRSLL